MRYFLICISLVCLLTHLQAQDSLKVNPSWGSYTYKDVYMGLHSSPKFDSLDAGYHAVEVGVVQSHVSNFIHFASGSFYIGQELGIWNEKLIHGTKAGIWASANAITLGLEFSHQTDYDRHAFNLWPSFGIGAYPFKLSMAGRVRLSGKSFQPQNKISFNLTYMLFRLSSRKKEIKTRSKD